MGTIDGLRLSLNGDQYWDDYSFALALASLIVRLKITPVVLRLVNLLAVIGGIVLQSTKYRLSLRE